MSDEELKEGQEPEEGAEGVPGHDEEELNTEWLGEEEWDDEEEVEDELAEEEEVPAFVDNGDGTISDTRNKLMWAQSDSYAEFKYGINWFEAQDYCESANEKQLAGYDDWRLCSTEEAKMMFSFAKNNIDKDGAEIHIDVVFEEGGGFLMFYARDREMLKRAMIEAGLEEVRFRFDFEGTTTTIT